MAVIPGSTNSNPTKAAIPPAVLRRMVPNPKQSALSTVRNSAAPMTVRNAPGEKSEWWTLCWVTIA